MKSTFFHNTNSICWDEKKNKKFCAIESWLLNFPVVPRTMWTIEIILYCRTFVWQFISSRMICNKIHKPHIHSPHTHTQPSTQPISIESIYSRFLWFDLSLSLSYSVSLTDSHFSVILTYSLCRFTQPTQKLKGKRRNTRSKTSDHSVRARFVKKIKLMDKSVA